MSPILVPITALSVVGCRTAKVGPMGDLVTLSQIGVSGTVIGFHKGLGIGEVSPAFTITGIPLYGFYWDKPAVTGKFFIKWGINGDVKLPGVDQIHLETVSGAPLPGNSVAVWSEPDKAYVLTNLPMAQHMNQEYTAGNIPPFSFHMAILPDPFIRITYAQLMRKV